MKRSAVYGWLAHWLVSDEPQAPPAAFDWDLALEAASYHAATPGLARRLAGRAWVPEPTADYLAAVLFLNRERNQRLEVGLSQTAEWLCDAGLAPLLIKGSSLLASQMLSDPGERLIGDLDILLPDEAQVQAGRDVLIARGFRFMGQAEHIDHQLGMAEHPVEGYGIELHRRMVSARYRTALDEGRVFRDAREMHLGGARVRVPAPEDRLLIAMAHGQLHDRGHEFGIVGLRLLQDIALHRAQPQGESHYAIAMAEAMARDAAIYAPIADLVEAARTSPQALCPRMTEALDSRPHRLASAGHRLIRSFPRFARMSWTEKRAALSLARWRGRKNHVARRW